MKIQEDASPLHSQPPTRTPRIPAAYVAIRFGLIHQFSILTSSTIDPNKTKTHNTVDPTVDPKKQNTQ